MANTISKKELVSIAPAMETYRELYKEYIEMSPEALVEGDLILRIASAFAELAPVIGASVLEELDQLCEEALTMLSKEAEKDL